MKVLAINGSPRKSGNTAILLEKVLEPLIKDGIEVEVYNLGGKDINSCTGCFNCIKLKNKRCSHKNDILNQLLAKMEEVDAIIIGSPTYFGDVTSEVKTLIDVTGFVSRANGFLLSRKIGAAICVSRRAGALRVLDTINNFFLINDMITVGSNYWNIALGRNSGDVIEDIEGLVTMNKLGQNISWLLRRIHKN